MTDRCQRTGPSVDVIVLAGGAGTRLGGRRLGDKALVTVGDSTLLSTVIDSFGHGDSTGYQLGAVIVVGPERVADGIVGSGPARVRLVHEQPPGSGPVAAIAAGLDLAISDVVAVVGGDMPRVGQALPSLLSALEQQPTVDAAALIDPAGPRRFVFLASLWRRRRLEGVLSGFADLSGLALRHVIDRSRIVGVVSGPGWADDIDTSTDLAAARARTHRSRRSR